MPFDFDNQIMVVRSDRRRRHLRRARSRSCSSRTALSDMPYSVIGRQTVWGHQIRWTSAGNISVDPNDPSDITVVFADRGTPNPNADRGLLRARRARRPTTTRATPARASDTDVYMVRIARRRRDLDRPRRRRRVAGRPVVPVGRPQARRHARRRLGTRTSAPARRARQRHIRPRAVDGGGGTAGARRRPEHRVDISVTHWAGQYVPQDAWPTVCGPERLQRPAGHRRRGQGLQRVPRRLHRPRRRTLTAASTSSGPASTARDLAADRPLHRRAARRLRAGRMYARRTV